jgi:hypothetical protein
VKGWRVLADNWTVLRLKGSSDRLVATPQRLKDNQGGVRAAAAALVRYARAGCPYGRPRRELGLLRPRCRGSKDDPLHETAFGEKKGGPPAGSRRPKSREEMPKEGTVDIRVSGEKCSGDLAANCSYLLTLHERRRLIRGSAISSSPHLAPHTFPGLSAAVLCKGIDAKLGYLAHFNPSHFKPNRHTSLRNRLSL